MPNTFLRVVLSCLSLSLGPRAHAAPPRQHYVLNAQLVPRERTVHGTLTLTLHNRTARPLDALMFHLYLNAFRDERSVFMRESRGALRGVAAHGRGKVSLERLVVAQHDLLATAERELLPDDFTQLRVPLPTPLAVGEHLQIELAFTARLPPLFARSGYHDNFFIVAQWFPKLAKLESDGHFVSFPYHGLGEFYADFADYDVTLRVPAGFTVATTSKIEREERRGTERVLQVRAAQVHDFAWVAAPDLTMERQRVGSVDLKVLAPSADRWMISRHMQLVAQGLTYFGKLLSPYPYSTLTVVVPPKAAAGGAGMEYPTLLLSDYPDVPFQFLPSATGEYTTAHELAHQWFYGLLASNEVRYPVLDEGFAEWATLHFLEARSAPPRTHQARAGADRFELARARALHSGPTAPPGLAAPEYSAHEYPISVYSRAALVLETIRRSYGAERFARALRGYTTQNRFAHPTPLELGRAFDEVYGQGFAKRVLFPLLLEGRSVEVAIASAETRRDGAKSTTTVRARHLGDVAIPTSLCALDDAGRVLARAPFSARERAQTLAIVTPEPATQVALDCDRALLLDPNVQDQIWILRSAPDPGHIAKLSALTQLILRWLGP